MTAPKVALLATGLGFGGAERELAQLARGLAGRGWPVTVASLLPLGGFAEELEAAGLPVVSLGMRRGAPSLPALWRLRRWLAAERPAVLHGFMVHANLMARTVRLLVELPVVISTAQNTREGGRWIDLALRWSDPLADWTTQVSRAGEERYRAEGLAHPERLELVPNSVDAERFRPDAAARARLRQELGAGERFVWLAVGRLEPQKDYPNLLAAFAPLAAADPGPLLWIAGQGPLAAELAARVVNLGLGERVRFLGLRRDVAAVLAAADGYVMSSAWEGTPLALLEAAATALPAVVTDVGGNADIVVAPQGGRVVPAASPPALAAALGELTARPRAELQAMGGYNRARVVGTYGLDRTLDRWEAIYRRLLLAWERTSP